MIKFIMRYVIFLLLAVAGTVFAAPPPAIDTAHVHAALLAENTRLTAGADNWVALQLRPRAGWHTYWRNPGDAGLPTRLHWTLPDGVRAGDIRWPAPQRLMVDGIANFGYDRATLHLVPIHVPQDWPTQRPLTLRLRADWLVCKDICVPEHADLALTRDVQHGAASVDKANASAFAAARAALPQPLPERWTAAYGLTDDTFTLALRGVPSDVSQVVFFDDEPGLLAPSAAQRLARDDDGLRLSVARAGHDTAPATVHGVLRLTTADGQPHAYAITARAGTPAPAAVPASAAATAPSAIAAITTTALPALLLALLGGLLLNLMPCVFPVLSMKALAVVKSSQLSAGARRRHALAYGAGVVLSCVTAAAILMALRAGGASLGWGFQLQSPPFVAALAELMFVLGLSMSGVFSFGGRLMGVGQSLTQAGGLAGSFFTGVLAVVVASPCSAPFMATALGYALSQPPAMALGVFAVLGLGMALPFLLLGFVPGLARWLPRPGAWMETFKQLMAFPLYLSAVWLVWVLARQQGADAAGIALLAMVLLSIGLWAHGRWPQARVALATLGVCVVTALALLAHPALTAAGGSPAALASDSAAYQPYSDARLAALRRDGRTVFVNFTADWCLTCKVNEHLTLASADVRAAFRRQHVAWLQADWTHADPAISRALARFHRSGVPLYLVYLHGGEPQVLPQILTPATVIDAVTPPSSSPSPS